MVWPGEKVVTSRHEMNLLGARGRRNLIEQAGRIAADDLVVFADQEDELARVLLEAIDDALRANIARRRDEQQPLRLVGPARAATAPAPAENPSRFSSGWRWPHRARA